MLPNVRVGILEEQEDNFSRAVLEVNRWFYEYYSGITLGRCFVENNKSLLAYFSNGLAKKLVVYLLMQTHQYRK